MHYDSVAEARAMQGLRLVLTAHYDAPWCETAKAIFRLRGVPFAPVEQIPFEPNHDLVAWTGFSNAPVAIYNHEPPRAHWLEIALLAERLGSGPSLLPSDQRERMLCLGIATEIASEDGFGWTCRMLTLTHLWGSGEVPADAPPGAAEGRRRYGYSPAAAAGARARLLAILRGLADQLREQKQAGSDYFVGRQLSLADVLWATFASFVAPPPHDVSPMPVHQRALYVANGCEIDNSVEFILLAHRNMIFERHLGERLEF